MGISATPSLIARRIASMHTLPYKFSLRYSIYTFKEHILSILVCTEQSTGPMNCFFAIEAFKISHKKGISFIDGYTDIQNQLLNRTEIGKWPVPSLAPRLSIPELVSQLWRKLGRKVWEDFTMPPCCHWKLWGHCVSSKTLSHLGLASSWLPNTCTDNDKYLVTSLW